MNDYPASTDTDNSTQPKNNKISRKTIGKILIVISIILGIASAIISIYVFGNQYEALYSNLVFISCPIILLIGIYLVASKWETLSPEQREIKKENHREAFLSISIVISIFRIVISITTYYNMLFGDAPWAEGRVFGYFTGFFNLFWLAICLILNLLCLKYKKLAPKIISWVLLAMVLVFAILILAVKPN